jgi:hypothetical protein
MTDFDREAGGSSDERANLKFEIGNFKCGATATTKHEQRESK